MAEQLTQLRDGYLLAAILQSEDALSEVQRQLKLINPNLQVSLEQLRELIRSSVLRSEVLAGAGADRAMGRLAEARDQAVAAAATVEGNKGNRQVRITGTYKAVPPKDDEEGEIWHDKMMSSGGG